MMLKRMKRRWRVCSPCSWSGSAWFWDGLTESLLFQDISTGALRMPTTMMMTRRGKGRSPCNSRGSRRSRPGSPPSSQTLPAEVCKIKVILVSFANWLESGCHLQFQEQAGWGTRLDFWEWVQKVHYTIFYCSYMISGLRSFTTG